MAEIYCKLLTRPEKILQVREKNNAGEITGESPESKEIRIR